jgi:hypothetical protein
MKNIKSLEEFILEASGNYGSIDANGHQIDYYATDWDKGKLAYISIINKNGIGWVLRKVGIFYDLEIENMRQYNNEIQHMMLDSAIKRDKYEYFLCKNETTSESFKIRFWQDLIDEDPTGSIKEPELGIKPDDLTKQMENLFPFIYFTNAYS